MKFDPHTYIAMVYINKDDADGERTTFAGLNEFGGLELYRVLKDVDALDRFR